MKKGIPLADSVDVAVLNDLIRSSAIAILTRVIQTQEPAKTRGECRSLAIQELLAEYRAQKL